MVTTHIKTFPKTKQLLPYEYLKMYRNRTGLSQIEFAKAIGLNSRRMVQYWEAGNSLPRADKLKKIIALLWELKIFIAGQEREEAEALWAAVKDSFEERDEKLENYPVFDVGWFEKLMAKKNPVIEPLPAKKGAEKFDLPDILTSFVGREQELAELKQLLLKDRLVTLIGTGGCGKTRLAIKVAEEVKAQFQDGIYFVNLANVQDPSLVATAVAQTLNLRELNGSIVSENIQDYLKNKNLLLILDNFEQILAASAQVWEWLSNCRPLKVLITSRVGLNLYGEQQFNLSPLPLPDDTNALENCPSVMLLLERVRAYQSDCSNLHLVRWLTIGDRTCRRPSENFVRQSLAGTLRKTSSENVGGAKHG
jgi:transcriptional regulator with XRE-family HTH domain